MPNPTVRETWQKLKKYFKNWRSSRADQVPTAQALLTKRRTRHPWFLRLLPSIGLSSTRAWISSSRTIELTEAGFRRMGQAHSAGLDTVIEVDRRSLLHFPASKPKFAGAAAS